LAQKILDLLVYLFLRFWYFLLTNTRYEKNTFTLSTNPIHFQQSTAKASEVPSMTQIKNLVNRLKMKQKVDVTSSSMDNTSEGFSFLGDQTTTNVFDQIENGLNGLNGLMGN
jgi:hypothetical protein